MVPQTTLVFTLNPDNTVQYAAPTQADRSATATYGRLDVFNYQGPGNDPASSASLWVPLADGIATVNVTTSEIVDGVVLQQQVTLCLHERDARGTEDIPSARNYQAFSAGGRWWSIDSTTR
jgi:hypothetical protein